MKNIKQEKKSMIKNLIYLDEQKMYSLSSQLFEGVTEYVLRENALENQDEESQKGPLASGKILAEVIKTSSKSVEKKFLHDYSYSIFEKYLIDQNRVLEISSPYPAMSDLKDSINNFSFVKVKAKAIFNDIKKITELFTSFNKLGEAFAHTQAFSEIRALETQLKSETDRPKRAQIEAKLKGLRNFSKIAKENDLYQDPAFLEHVSLLTNYGFSDQFEIHQHCEDVLFTSCLKRDFLREKEELLVKKYSRKTEKEIIVLGIISQDFSQYPIAINDNANFQNMKAALTNFIEHLSNVEMSIGGKLDNEIVIDPIAAYIEV